MAERKEQGQQRQEARREVQPVADLLRAEIAKELVKLTRIETIEIDSLVENEHLKAELMARKLAAQSLLAIQTRLLNNIIREPRTTTPE
jgi:hypothetical protein